MKSNIIPLRKSVKLFSRHSSLPPHETLLVPKTLLRLLFYKNHNLRLITQTSCKYRQNKYILLDPRGRLDQPVRIVWITLGHGQC